MKTFYDLEELEIKYYREIKITTNIKKGQERLMEIEKRNFNFYGILYFCIYTCDNFSLFIESGNSKLYLSDKKFKENKIYMMNSRNEVFYPINEEVMITYNGDENIRIDEENIRKVTAEWLKDEQERIRVEEEVEKEQRRKEREEEEKIEKENNKRLSNSFENDYIKIENNILTLKNNNVKITTNKNFCKLYNYPTEIKSNSWHSSDFELIEELVDKGEPVIYEKGELKLIIKEKNNINGIKIRKNNFKKIITNVIYSPKQVENIEIMNKLSLTKADMIGTEKLDITINNADIDLAFKAEIIDDKNFMISIATFEPKKYEWTSVLKYFDVNNSGNFRNTISPKNLMRIMIDKYGMTKQECFDYFKKLVMIRTL